MNDLFYLLKIRLLHIEPEIWRRVAVPSDITLDRLHDIIQIVMGWTDSHLHEFTIGKKRYSEYPESKEDGLACGRYRLGNLVKRRGRTFMYSYDFGDGWEHEVTLEENPFALPEMMPEIFCFDGERACPPEDVGGVPGYYGFCKVMDDPTHEDYEALMDWFGGKYDPVNFNLDAVNDDLIRYMRWSRDRYQDWPGNY